MGGGFGWLAFAGVASGTSAPSPLAPKTTHLPARAKRVIFLCMRGAPSHVDTLDYKPKLNADTGKPAPKAGAKLLGSAFKFAQHGHSGQWISELFPQLAKRADDLCVVRSMQTDLPAHPQAFIKLHTGTSQFVRPSLGAWALYGLGTLNQNLPGFVSITPPSGFGGAQNYGSSFLPAIYQGTRIGTDGRPIAGAEMANLRPKISAADQRAELDLAQTLNRHQLARERVSPEIEGVIESFELAFKMQTEMPAVMDLNRESDATKKLYGIGTPATEDFGRKCLLARQLVEAGVRFVEITHGNWDHHFNLVASLRESSAAVDQPLYGLLTDLAARGLLKDTLVIWTGEFGRTPHVEGADGRDHNVGAFSLWMAGGGVKPGHSFGRSDDYGYEAVEDKLPIHDFHATLLHLLGLDHEKLTCRHAGRDFRLTDTKGAVAKGILA
ncbi:MAG: DUF1501 domain-containing protein [Verrucomicrobia bacterium]|nr:DUF1501 domain-containing protein [Verrucomicrobiota bacterium]